MAQRTDSSPDIPIEALGDRLEAGQKLLGLDLGSKTIGLAISDAGRIVASPRFTIRRRKFTQDIRPLLQICAEENIGGIIIGLPINMNGTEGPRAQSTRAFVKNLSCETDIPIVLWDERLSTAAAERAMIEADLSRSKRAKRVDAIAATFILQGALDRMRI